MIDWNKSAEHNRMSVEELKAWFEQYPNSMRKVYRICDGGCVTGDRWINHRWHTNLCQNCTKKFRVGKNSSAWKGGKVMVICSYCGKKIEKFPCEKREHNFCSKQHRDKWLIGKINKNNPTYGKYGRDNPNYGRHNTETTIIKMRESAKKRVYDSKPCITCGKEFIPNNNVQLYCKDCVSIKYCEKFNEPLKTKIRTKYDNCDYISGIHKDICNNKKTLSVHHVNYDKNCGCDGVKCKLIPLSNSNHSKTNTNRPFWNKLFIYALEIDTWYYTDT